MKEAHDASARRNEIAHGIVQPVTHERRSLPSYYDTKKRSLSRQPKYTYSATTP
jgi:hypothetical protein